MEMIVNVVKLSKLLHSAHNSWFHMQDIIAKHR